MSHRDEAPTGHKNAHHDDAGDAEDAGACVYRRPWPQAGDDLFGHGKNPLGTDATSMRGDINAYAESYRSAAEVLYDHIARTYSGQEYLLFPLMFLWRQHIELKLKHIIHLGRVVLDGTTGYEKHHRIADLWADARALLEKFDPGFAPDCANADVVIRQLASVDADSFDFRYPSTKKGAVTLASMPMRVDHNVINDVMLGVSEFLRAGVSMLEVAYDAQVAQEYGY
jgi:hypothetical protein